MNLTIKSVPEALHEQLRQQAQDHRRSLNQEIIWLLESALKRPKRLLPEDFLVETNKLHRKIGFSLSLQEIDQAIESGRP